MFILIEAFQQLHLTEIVPNVQQNQVQSEYLFAKGGQISEWSNSQIRKHLFSTKLKLFLCMI